MPVGGLSGLNELTGITALEEDQPFASPEDRMGGIVDPLHSRVGEQARPYAWESPLTQSAGMPPLGLENGLLADEWWFLEPAGTADTDPAFDAVMPNITMSHGAPHNVTNSGAIPSQYGAICEQVDQIDNHGNGMGSSRGMQLWDSPQQDNWNEIWNVTPGNTGLVPIPAQIQGSIAGFGNRDRTQSMARQNSYGFDSAHFHRRYAQSPIPGNYMYLIPQGRPLFKSLAGPARPPIGQYSPFEGDDTGAAFGIQGAILQNQPQEYVPPPSPYVAATTTDYGNPMGTDGEDWF